MGENSEDSHGSSRHRPIKVKHEVDSEEEPVTVKQEPPEGRVRVKKERWDNAGVKRERWDNSDVRVKQERADRRDRSRGEYQRQREERRDNDRRREDNRRRNPLPENAAEAGDDADPEDKAKPNFELSGKLTEETNTFRGVVIKYSEPPEARKPRKRWRFYPFKGDQALPVLHVSRQSAYLLGRDRKIADMPIDHPSCSKQHAVLQYRLVEYERDDGTEGRQVRPYIIDLESANGTFVNNKRIDAKRYVELQEKDVLKFGFSTREYVLLHDKTSTDEVQDSDDGESG